MRVLERWRCATSRRHRVDERDTTREHRLVRYGVLCPARARLSLHESILLAVYFRRRHASLTRHAPTGRGLRGGVCSSGAGHSRAASTSPFTGDDLLRTRFSYSHWSQQRLCRRQARRGRRAWRIGRGRACSAGDFATGRKPPLRMQSNAASPVHQSKRLRSSSPMHRRGEFISCLAASLSADVH